MKNLPESLARRTVPGRPQISYLDTENEAPAVVFSHGFFMDARMFLSQAAVLVPDYRFLSVDARGHGLSAAASPFDYWDLARDQLAVMDAAGIASAHLVGHSQGGFTAMRIALLAPERVRSLTLLASDASANSLEQMGAYEDLFGLWQDAGVPQEVLDQLAMQLVGDLQLATPWSERWRDYDRSALAYASQALIHRDDLMPQLAAVRAPVMLISGSNDSSFHAHSQQALAQAFTGTTVETHLIDGAAHAASLSHPDAVNRLLRDFLHRTG